MNRPSLARDQLATSLQIVHVREPASLQSMLRNLSRLFFVWDDDLFKRPGRPGNLIEPAPPTYEEATTLSLFVREPSTTSARDASSQRRRSAGRLRSESASGSEEDSHAGTVERWQMDEIELERSLGLGSVEDSPSPDPEDLLPCRRDSGIIASRRNGNIIRDSRRDSGCVD